MGRWDNKRTIDGQWSVNECIGELYDLNTTLRSDITKEFENVSEQIDELHNSLLTTNLKLAQSLNTLSRLKIWLVVLTVAQVCLVLTKLFIDL